MEEQNLALRWDTQISGWRVVGDAADFAMSDIRQQIKRLIIEAGEPLGPKDVSERGDLDYEQVKKEMQRMADAEQLFRVGRGKYIVSSVPSVTVVPSVPAVPSNGDEAERDNEDNVVPFAVPVESAKVRRILSIGTQGTTTVTHRFYSFRSPLSGRLPVREREFLRDPSVFNSIAGLANAGLDWGIRS